MDGGDLLDHTGLWLQAEIGWCRISAALLLAGDCILHGRGQVRLGRGTVMGEVNQRVRWGGSAAPAPLTSWKPGVGVRHNLIGQILDGTKVKKYNILRLGHRRTVFNQD